MEFIGKLGRAFDKLIEPKTKDKYDKPKASPPQQEVLPPSKSKSEVNRLFSENNQLNTALDQSAREVRRLVEDLHRLEAVRDAAQAVILDWQEGRPLDQPLGQLAAALVREGLVRKN